MAPGWSFHSDSKCFLGACTQTQNAEPSMSKFRSYYVSSTRSQSKLSNVYITEVWHTSDLELNSSVWIWLSHSNCGHSLVNFPCYFHKNNYNNMNHGFSVKYISCVISVSQGLFFALCYRGKEGWIIQVYLQRAITVLDSRQKSLQTGH